MCGVTGYLGAKPSVDPDVVMAAMTEALHHRGPDSRGAWIDRDAGVGLGHTRLSIIDLSAAGAQPMESSCGRMVLVYNGEIYNAAEIHEQLEAAGRTQFRGHSDTEVLVEACAQWGVRSAAERLIGMFAFAVWDRSTRTLSLVRDRMGIKPMYWAQTGQTFLFGSELKSFRAFPGFETTIDRNSLASFTRLGHVPAPYSIYERTRKLEPGCILAINPQGEPRIERYWDLRQVASDSQLRGLDISDTEAIAQGESLISDAVKRRMIADVPLGAFLSGGIDSSTVVALMQAHSSRPVRTFSIGSSDPDYDEAPNAAAVAKHLGTDHTELYIGPEEARSIIPLLPDMFDEPFADSSQIPTYLVSQLTRRHVTVALSGDGGDEIFAGYNRYLLGDAVRRRMHCLPLCVRRSLARLLLNLSTDRWDQLCRLIPGIQMPSHPGQKLHKLAAILPAEDEMAMYRQLISYWPEGSNPVPGGTPVDHPAWNDDRGTGLTGYIERMQLIDGLTFLPDDMLTKVDRASMAVALEARVPLLDHRVVEFAWSLPHHMRVRNGEGKWLLRRILEQHVPTGLTSRAKMGFSLPMANWLRGPLREWAEDLLAPAALADGDLLNPAEIRSAWQAFIDGRAGLTNAVWAILMFQAWRRHWA